MTVMTGIRLVQLVGWSCACSHHSAWQLPLLAIMTKTVTIEKNSVDLKITHHGSMIWLLSSTTMDNGHGSKGRIRLHLLNSLSKNSWMGQHQGHQSCRCFLEERVKWSNVLYCDDPWTEFKRLNVSHNTTFCHVEKTQGAIWTLECINTIWPPIINLEHILGRLPLFHQVLCHLGGSCICQWSITSFDSHVFVLIALMGLPASHKVTQHNIISKAGLGHLMLDSIKADVLNEGRLLARENKATDKAASALQAQKSTDKGNWKGKHRIPEEKACFAKWVKIVACRSFKELGHLEKWCPKKTGRDKVSHALLLGCSWNSWELLGVRACATDRLWWISTRRLRDDPY